MINQTQFFDYLKDKIPGFEKTQKKGQFLFTCCNEKNHKYKGKSPTMTVIPGSDKYYCLQCGFKGTVYDCIRLLEKDKKSFSDGQIMDYLTNSGTIDAYPEFDSYKNYGFSLVPIAKNGKVPLEKDWTNKTHTEKSEWLKWVESGINLGIRTGEVSGITVIDVDLKVAPAQEMNEIYKNLMDSKTLMQNTPHGKHFIFKYDKEIKQTTKIAGITIDVRNDGGQILCSPSKINVLSYNWINLGNEIKEIPENVKSKLLTDKGVDKGRIEDNPGQNDLELEEMPKLKNNNLLGCCNDTFVKLGGLFINKLGTENTEFVLSVFNTQLLEQPMPLSAIKAMMGSLEGYKKTEEQTQESAIYECCKLLQQDISAKDVMEHTQLKRAIIDKYLAKFYKEGQLSRKGRGRYELKQKIEWTNISEVQSVEYPYKIPYFNDIAHFYSGDIIIIGAPTGRGKTHVALNFIRLMKEQGVKPYYISLEAGSRHEKIAKQLGLTQSDYYISKEPIINPLQVELEENAFTIIDWLNLGEDFAATPAVFQHLSNEMKRKGGILVVFNQLRDDYRWFAPDLVKQFARLSARFVYDDQTGIISHFDCDKITDPKGHYLTANISTEFSFDNKELKQKEII
jgi:hypothetical protein